MLIDEVIRVSDKFREKTIIVGLSGGADSVCLTHALKSSGFSVVAAHVNHCLRGSESDGDQKFAEEFCKRYGIPIFVKRADVAMLAKSLGCGTEDAGRRVRYEFFESLADEKCVIATAHNKNDAAETILINLIRGSGGLKGIPEREDCIRPLINVTRAEIEEYCKDNSLEFRTDSSNLSEDYTRNKIRLSIIPELKKINPSVENALLRAAEINALDKQIAEDAADAVKLEKIGDRWFAEYSNIPIGVLYRVIRRMYAKVYGSYKNLSFENVRAASCLVKSGNTGKLSELGHGIFLETTYGGFLVGKMPEKKEFCTEIRGKTVISEVRTWISAYTDDKPSGKISFDADAVGKIIARCRKNGDRLCLNGNTKKLKDIFIERKIPKEQRDKAVVLEGSCGVIGVIGLGFDKKFKANDETVKFLNVDWGEYNE